MWSSTWMRLFSPKLRMHKWRGGVRHRFREGISFASAITPVQHRTREGGDVGSKSVGRIAYSSEQNAALETREGSSVSIGERLRKF